MLQAVAYPSATACLLWAVVPFDTHPWYLVPGHNLFNFAYLQESPQQFLKSLAFEQEVCFQKQQQENLVIQMEPLGQRRSVEGRRLQLH